MELGAELDLLTKDELAGELRTSADAWQRSIASGVKHLDFPVLQTQVASSAFQLGGLENPPAAGAVRCGPQQGWYWRIERVSVAGLLTTETGVIQLFKGSTAQRRFVCNINPVTGVYHPGGSALILRPDDNLIVVGSAITTAAGTTIYLTGEADATPAEQLYKLVI